MDYIELTLSHFGDFNPEIAVAELAELGFESFSETDDIINAYIPADGYVAEAVTGYLEALSCDHGLQWSINRVAERNWNEEWERSYEPVVIEGRCRVRAPFHEPSGEYPYELVIEPRMSFGTAHHETTYLVIAMLLDTPVSGKQVLDMGCGTGLLALLAGRMGASRVVAIDNDEWAVSNAADNMERNGAPHITVIRGEASDIPKPSFDVVLANINRNILMADMPAYAGATCPGGVLILSGFYEEDMPVIRQSAEGCGFRYDSHSARNRWVAARFRK